MSRLTQGEQDLAFWTKHLKGEQCFVYVIQGDPDTPIKVGRAKDVPARMATPDPVDPEEAKRRLASHWARPYRNQRLDAA